jgi:uncharacterized protein YbaR (Trm112 family)
MNLSTFDILRCPYCGSRLDLVTSSYHRTSGDEIQDGIIGCQCCVFPIVDGIPVMHLQPAAVKARELVERGEVVRARRVMFGLEDDAVGERVDGLIASSDATYRTIVEAFGEYIEGGYFLYRFADPTYIAGHAVVRAVAGTVLREGGRAIDICGGSGHLTRSLMDLSSPAPVLADLYFSKIWLARRFTAPGCEPVCCDGNSPMPFARGAFRYAMCSDAFMYIWTKRQFVQDMLRVTDNRDDAARSAAVISHTHNQCTWTPSHGQPLTPGGYGNLFETIEPRIFGESALFGDVVAGGPLDLSRRAVERALEAEPALTLVASRHPGVFLAHALEPAPAVARGEFRVNPLYVFAGSADAGGPADPVLFRLQFPSEDYEQEYGACRQYLPDEVAIGREALSELGAGRVPAGLADLVRRRVIVDLPRLYDARPF